MKNIIKVFRSKLFFKTMMLLFFVVITVRDYVLSSFNYFANSVFGVFYYVIAVCILGNVLIDLIEYLILRKNKKKRDLE